MSGTKACSEPFKLSIRGNYRTGQLSSKRTSVLQKLSRLKTRNPPTSHPAILMLPPELICHIAKWLSLEDCACLALVCRAFISLFSFTWGLLDVPHNKASKIRFLRRLDKLNPSWLLCQQCSKYHRWSRDEPSYPRPRWAHDYQVAQTIRINDQVMLPQAAWRLVKRARVYKDLTYGKQIESLRQSYQSGNWTSVVEAIWDKQYNLIIRITSTTENYDGFSSLGYCECLSTELRERIQDICEMTTCGRKNSRTPWPPKHDFACRDCGAVYKVRRYCTGTHQHSIKIFRYHDLGPAKSLNYVASAHVVQQEGSEWDPVVYSRLFPRPYYMVPGGRWLPPPWARAKWRYDRPWSCLVVGRMLVAARDGIHERFPTLLPSCLRPLEYQNLQHMM